MKNTFGFNRLIVLFISVGFLVLAFEIYLQHCDQLADKKIMWTPIVFGILGGITGVFIYLVFDRQSYYLFFILMLISIGVGALGLFLHNKWRFPAFVNFLFYGKPFDFSILTSYTPLLAPSAFIAMGSLGILVALYYDWKDG